MVDRSVLLIDAQFLAMARRKVIPDSKWNPTKLHDLAERLTPRFHWRFRTYYFDALPFKARNNPDPADEAAYKAAEKHLEKIDRLERFTVIRGFCKEATARGPPDETTGERVRVRYRTQKMTDVQLATELTRIAWSEEAKHISLLAGDADYVPAVQAAKSAGALVRLYEFNLGNTRTADRLKSACDEVVDFRPFLVAMSNGTPRPPAYSRSLPAEVWAQIQEKASESGEHREVVTIGDVESESDGGEITTRSTRRLPSVGAG